MVVYGIVGIAVIVAILSAPVIAGYLTNISVTGPLYLKKQLKRRGVNVDSIPKNCLREMAEEAIRNTKLITSLTRKYWKHEVTNSLDLVAEATAIYLNNKRNHIKNINDEYYISAYFSSYEEILSRCGL